LERLTLLVSPDAEWLLADSAEFFDALGDPNPDYDAVGFAIKNLGFIKFESLSESVLEIELHPRNVDLPALLAVQEKVLSSSATLFRIKYFDTGWQSEISSSPEHTITRLSELCAPVFSPPATERFLVEHRDYATLFADEGNPLRTLVQKWRVSFANFDPSIMSLATAHGLLSRMMVIGIKRHNPDPIWRFIGDGHKWIGSQYHMTGIGDRVENMPDKEYGGWVNEFYKTVAMSGTPRYDHITGQLQYENEPGKPRRLISYERLLLPWKTRSDEVLVTMCSKVLGTLSPADGTLSPANSEVSNYARSA
jgi:hypothetical protein